MPETLKFDPKTYDWMRSNRWADITVVKCKKCGLHYKAELGHNCDMRPRLEFNRKIGDIELRACPPNLVAVYEGEPNDTIDVVLWETDAIGRRYCFSIANFVRCDGGYSLKFSGARPFLYVGKERVPELWEALQEAQEVLDKWFDDVEEWNENA